VLLPESQFINKGTPTDSVRIGKILASYNAGPGKVLKKLTEAKAKGVDIYHSFD
jgi:hypothetical protein